MRSPAAAWNWAWEPAGSRPSTSPTACRSARRSASASTGLLSSSRSSPGSGRRPQAARSTTPAPTTSWPGRQGCRSRCSERRTARRRCRWCSAGTARKRTPALAARFADEFNVGFAAPARTGAQIGRVRAACEAIGRDPAGIVYSAVQLVCLGSDPATLDAPPGGHRPRAGRTSGMAWPGRPARSWTSWPRSPEVGVSRMYLQILDLSDADHIAELGELNRPAAAL